MNQNPALQIFLEFSCQLLFLFLFRTQRVINGGQSTNKESNKDMDKKAVIFKFLKAIYQNDGDGQDENHKHKTDDGMKDVDSTRSDMVHQ